MTDPARRIFCALDTKDQATALDLARRLGSTVGGMKLGLEFFNAQGPSGVRALIAEGMPVFLDLKFHDIPNTVAGAVEAVTPLAPAFINVHAAGGGAMMRAAAEAASRTAQTAGVPRPLVLGVTVLTSLDQSDMSDIGVGRPVADQVVGLARLAQDNGLDGVVCSPFEIGAVRAACGPDFTLMVPGIRPAGADKGDQKRVMTPAEAVAQGADYLVIGRAITGADDPAAAATVIAGSL